MWNGVRVLRSLTSGVCARYGHMFMGTSEDEARYQAAAHAMQSGVAWELTQKGIDAETPIGRELKHVRVGVNSAMSQQGALARLLIAKGLFTQGEYMAAMADAMEAEKAMYEKTAREHYGQDGISFE